MIHYRLASDSDNQQLIELTAASGMAGETGLRIDRKPDFFSLLTMRGESKVFVATDNNTIIGSLCVSLQQVYAGGEIVPFYYVGDFKVAASYRNKGIGLQLCNEVADFVISNNGDLAFLNVSKGNTKPLSFFRDRPGVPDFENLGIFKIHQLIGKRKKIRDNRYKVEPAAVSDELISFLNRHYSKYELGSVITHEKLKTAEIFIIKEENKIIAAMCLQDTMAVKQNVVIRLDWKMKPLLTLLNLVSGIAGISKMPVLNEPVRMIYIRYLAVNESNKQIVKLLIGHARNIIYERSYSFASIGLHQKDPLNNCLAGIFKITFHSVGMLISIKDSKMLMKKIKKGIPFEDYSLV